MTGEFMRKERYIVFKMSDLGNSLKGDEIRRLAREYAEQRRLKGKKPLECVVVEKDWPEYEPTWKAIEARVTGAQPAPNAVAYLDLGAGGYMDIGTDLTDEELDAIPKGRHMLGIVGTYGIEGYVPAQTSPSVPDLLESLRCACNYIDKLGGASQQYRAVLASPEANPAPSVPDGWLHHAARMAALARKLREPDWHFESIREMQRELCALEEAALAATPEAKP